MISFVKARLLDFYSAQVFASSSHNANLNFILCTEYIKAALTEMGKVVAWNIKIKTVSCWSLIYDEKNRRVTKDYYYYLNHKKNIWSKSCAYFVSSQIKSNKFLPYIKSLFTGHYEQYVSVKYLINLRW